MHVQHHRAVHRREAQRRGHLFLAVVGEPRHPASQEQPPRPYRRAVRPRHAQIRASHRHRPRHAEPAEHHLQRPAITGVRRRYDCASPRSVAAAPKTPGPARRRDRASAAGGPPTARRHHLARRAPGQPPRELRRRVTPPGRPASSPRASIITGSSTWYRDVRAQGRRVLGPGQLAYLQHHQRQPTLLAAIRPVAARPPGRSGRCPSG